MLTLRGRIVNVVNSPARTTTEGEIIPPSCRVEILAGIVGKKMELFTLKTERGSAFQAAMGRQVECQVQPYAFAGERGGVVAGLSMVKDCEILLIDEATGKTTAMPADKKAAA